jgi:ribA/ribD-fused uncharacterized protein
MESTNLNRVINFYQVKGEYGFLSNFSPHPIDIDGRTWPTTEHFFQAQKFTDKNYQEAIRQEPKAIKAATMGRSRKVPIRVDWETVKEGVMEKALLAKFSQHADLKAQLLGTSQANLVEHTANDSYWGDGGDGSGQNRLGKLLMRVRDHLSKSHV